MAEIVPRILDLFTLYSFTSCILHFTIVQWRNFQICSSLNISNSLFYLLCFLSLYCMINLMQFLLFLFPQAMAHSKFWYVIFLITLLQLIDFFFLQIFHSFLVILYIRFFDQIVLVYLVLILSFFVLMILYCFEIMLIFVLNLES